MAKGKTKYGVGVEGIQSLEIRGTTNGDLDKFALIANRNQLISSGTEDYVLSVRESLLADKVRKFRVPEIWDRQWTHKLGPIWTPASASASTCELWLNPEGMTTNDAGDRVTSCEDASGNNRDFSQSVSGDQPAYAAKNSSANNFRAMTADGTSDQLNASLGTGIDHDTTQDWCWGFVAVLRDQHANTSVAQCTMAYNGNTNGNGTNNDEFACVLRYNTQNANERFQIRKQHASGLATFTYDPDITFNNNQPQMVLIGRTNGNSFLRLNGTAESSAGTDSRAHTAQGVDGGWGGGYQSSNTRAFQDPMFEWVVLNGTGTTGTIDTDVEKLEGYFAQKYGLLDLLPAGHTYKSDAPRASITV
jgi:hypothetical protein|tara:strand:+ start:166 stop:1248 length:1083 start_codon:yes stop_codon:yes gene_type:complete